MPGVTKQWAIRKRLLYPDKTSVNVIAALLALVGGALDKHHSAVVVWVDITVPIEVFVFMFLGGIK